ncbi:MAG: alpha/beta fold hydrolase [Thermoleophilaceae bacterium]|nr:alpha/beta fold hydrolase [Thermoleophilaceae bacterium]
MRPRRRQFRHEGHKLVFDEYGTGDRPVLLMPGLLLSRKMHGPLAAMLAERGYRVLCLDLLGHGDSDRPPEMWHYSITIFGSQALALMDHLELEKAVVGGTSLGANVALEAAAADQGRVQGMLLEMPVLDNALLGAVLSFTPLLLATTFGAPAARVLARAAGLVPRRGPLLARMALDCLSQDPKPSASVLQGLFFGRTAPPRSERAALQPPALVIGHQRDPIHPFSDADMLMGELPNARLVEASSILELRLSPDRLQGEIASFIDECWQAPGRRPPRRRSPRPSASKASHPQGGRRRGA